MEPPKTTKKRGRPALPPGEKLERGTLYLPADVWAKIEAAGRPALISHLRRWRVAPPAG